MNCIRAIKWLCVLSSNLPNRVLGLDRYRASARYPILSATGLPIPIPILEVIKKFKLQYTIVVLKVHIGCGD